MVGSLNFTSQILLQRKKTNTYRGPYSSLKCMIYPAILHTLGSEQPMKTHSFIWVTENHFLETHFPLASFTIYYTIYTALIGTVKTVNLLIYLNSLHIKLKV